MSPIPRVHRQVFQNVLLPTFILFLTLLCETLYTGSNGTSATAIFSPVLLLAFIIAGYVVGTVFSLSFALVPAYGCATVGHGTWTPSSFTKLVELYTSVCVRPRSFIAETLLTIDFVVELLIYQLSSAYIIKSGPELLQESLRIPEGPLSSSPPKLLNASVYLSTSDATISEVALVPAAVDPTATTLGSSKPGRASQGGAGLNSSPIETAVPNSSILGKSSVTFPRSPNAPTGGNPKGCIRPDGFAALAGRPKWTWKLVLKHSDFANVAKLRDSVSAAIAPGAASSPVPRIIVHEVLLDSSSSSSNSPRFAATTAPPAQSDSTTSKPSLATPRSSHLGLQADIPPEPAVDLESLTKAGATVPNIVVVTGNLQDSLRSSSRSPSSTTIAASFAHSTPPTLQSGPPTPFSNSTLDLDTDVEWETAGDPAGPTDPFLTPPQVTIVDGRFPDLASNYSYSSTPSTASSFAFSSSTTTIRTPATTPCSTLLYLQSDVELKNNAGSPTSTPDTTAEIELPKRDLRSVSQVDVTARTPDEVHLVDHRLREFGGQTNLFELDEDEVTEDNYRRRWAKREGRLPEGWRRIWKRPDLELAMPMSMTFAPLAAPQTDDDDLDDEGCSKGDVDRAILMSLGLPVDPTPLDGTSPDTVIDPQGRSFNRGIVIQTPATPPRSVLSETGNNEVDDDGFSRAELSQVIAESRPGASSLGFANPPAGDPSRPVSPSVSTTSTLVETDDEEDDVDDKGFSKKSQEKAMAESRAEARARPFYGASTSSAGDQTLSQEEWNMLEQYVATPSRPRTVVRPPSPASTDVDTEPVVPSSLPPPPPLPEATAPVKTRRIPRLRKFVKKLIPRNPFKNRNRGEAH